MSRAPHEAINVRGAETGDDRYPPQSAPNEASQGMSDFVDGSGPIFSWYLEMATEEDKKMAENWKADADGILIFTGLFSAAVASLISVSIQDIRPNPQDTFNFYLKNIYLQTVANTSSSVPASPPPFSPPSYAIWVNALWFLSLVISLTCALLATLLQQWARRYLKVTQPRYSLHKRARIRAFFAEGVERCLLPWAVEALPTLLHISLFLFFAGLIVFLSNVNLTIFKVVLSWVGLCTAVYGCITFLPIFRYDSPYHTPLSLLAWHIVTGIPFITFRVLRWFTGSVYFHAVAYVHFQSLEGSYRKLIVQGMQKTAEETALNLPSEVDTRAFLWTFDSSDEDHELERFFAGLPGFRSSKVVDDPLPGLTEEQKRKLSMGLMGLLDRTFSSDLLTESVKNRRAIISAKAIDPEYIPESLDIRDRILSNYRYSGSLAAEVVQIVRGWADNRDEDITLVAQARVSSVVARAQRRDDHWFVLASYALGVPESVLRTHDANGDDLSLAILIHITRQQFSHIWKRSWPEEEFSKVLEAASKFDVQDTSPELQHEFCALWNQVVLKVVQNDNARWMAFFILAPIRNVYIALHRDTDSAPTRFSASTDNLDVIRLEPSSYPVCDVAGHIPDDPASTTFSRTALVAVPLASPDAPSSSVPTPRLVDESPRMPASSLDPATARAIQLGGIVTSSVTIFHPTPDTSTSALPLSSTSPPASIAVRRIADRACASLDVLDAPSPPSPTPVFHHNTLPTDPQSSLDSPVTGSDHATSSPEPHSSLLAPAATDSPRPRLSSAPDLGAASEDKGNPKAGLSRDKDALDPSSVIRENIMAVLDVPPQSPSPPSVTGVAITGPSRRSFNAEHTGDHLPHPSRGQYDIV